MLHISHCYKTPISFVCTFGASILLYEAIRIPCRDHWRKEKAEIMRLKKLAVRIFMRILIQALAPYVVSGWGRRLLHLDPSEQTAVAVGWIFLHVALAAH